MAKKLTEGDADGDGRVTSMHNVKARDEALQEALKEVYAEDQAIDALTEKHIQAHRDQKGIIKKRIHEGLGIPSRAFNKHYALWRLQQEALETENGAMLDHLRELQRAAQIGVSVDFIEALEEKQAQEAAKGGDGGSAGDKQAKGKGGKTPETTVEQANAAGVKAGLAGAAPDDNPFTAGSPRADAWEAGRFGGEKQARVNAGGAANPPEGATSH